MNENPNRSELNSLKSELERVEWDLRFLRTKAEQLEQRISATEKAAVAPPIIEPAFTTPPVLTPAPEIRIPERALPAEPSPVEQIADPVPLTLATEPRVKYTPPPIPPPLVSPTIVETPAPEPIFQSSTDSEPPQTPAPSRPASFEMRLGTYWFVRIGIVMVLTALVFLGNYAYKRYIGLAGPLGKVVMLYAVSGGLLAAGAMLPRRDERLKNYGQVLFAGGLAAVYFTTYAAHHFDNLRIITSAILDGALLLAWTSFIVWLADRRKSEVLALFAIGLAYYTALITNVGNFTLISNLLLAIAAVFFLIRNRWVALTFLSIIASYGSYFYWRYYAGGAGIDEFAGRISICGYWVIFTAAVFLSRAETFAGRNRASFLTLNNAAAFTLLTASLYHHQSGRFWQLALAAGFILLTLAAAAKKLLASDIDAQRAYLAQGILLTTLAAITKLSGPTLALVLATESAMLLIFSLQWRSRLMQAFSTFLAGLSAGYFLSRISANDPHAWWQAFGVFGLLMFNAFWSSSHTEHDNPNVLRPLPTYFGVVALVSWIGSIFTIAPPFVIAPTLCATTVLLTTLYYLLAGREIILLGQVPLAIGLGQLFITITDGRIPQSWSPVTTIFGALLMCVWWHRQATFAVERDGRTLFSGGFAIAAAAVTYVFLPHVVAAERLILAQCAMTLIWIILAWLGRTPAIALAGQGFVIAAAIKDFLSLLTDQPPGVGGTTEIIITLLVLGAVAHLLTTRASAFQRFTKLPDAYQWFAAILTFLATFHHAPAQFQFLILATFFAASFAATFAGARYTFGPGLALAVAGAIFWLFSSVSAGSHPANFLAILILVASQIVARKKSDTLAINDSARHFWVGANSALIWLYTSRWVIAHSAGEHFYLTASWALLAFALFGISFALRERVYRWSALVVLGSALGRVIVLDVWRLETIYRILSFLALGIVLLILGYVYTRYQDRITKWL